MGGIQPWHIILVVVVFLLLFGGKKLPDAARGLGRSLRILKSEVSAMHEDDAKPSTEGTAGPITPSQIAPAALNSPPIAQPTVQVPGAAPVAAPVIATPVSNGSSPANAFPAPHASNTVTPGGFSAPAVPPTMPVPVINVPNAPANGQQNH